MLNLEVTLYHRRPEDALDIVRGPAGPLVQLLQTTNVFRDGSHAPLLEYAQLCSRYDPFAKNELPVPFMGNLVFVDSVTRTVLIRAEGWDGPFKRRLRVDAFSGLDAQDMDVAGRKEPTLRDDLDFLARSVYAVHLKTGLLPVAYADRRSLLKAVEFDRRNVYCVKSPTWTLQEGFGDLSTSAAVRDLLLTADLISKETAQSWFSQEPIYDDPLVDHGTSVAGFSGEDW
jgi:hypothetical protein